VGSGGVCVCRDSGIWSQAVGFVHVIFQKSDFDRREDVFITKTFYKCCAFNAIHKDNAEINCITVQHKKDSFPSTLTGHTTLVS
jgi:hypothetical protein